ncbi:hypothetical protein AWY79_02350 [Pseudodesulfovibrio indicus]|uniref:Uncharacterized protein n=1 Tax=Pseudodesulfovibrio indicus TaxID=1716143 RepID=A0ABN4LWF0_9BACT|nr:hypothetical protein AWY79_02350 [Pseudodesulfovibrio indicus]
MSYVAPSALKLITFIQDGRPVFWVALPILSSALLVILGVLTFKGSLISKYLMCGFLMLCGLLMVPYYFSPAIEAVPMRLFLGSYGLGWIVSSIWIFKVYPTE